jgi:hypothetical protein
MDKSVGASSDKSAAIRGLRALVLGVRFEQLRYNSRILPLARNPSGRGR